MISLKGVSKTFTSNGVQVQAIGHVDLQVQKNEIFGIVGLSGAGKSTLVRLINRLEVPDRGKVLVEGLDLSTLSSKDLQGFRRKVGMIFQHFQLLTSRTVHGNVALPLELAGWSKTAIDDRVKVVLDLVGLSEKVNQYTSQLSGGQKQRVAIARAIATSPDILLCDEATSALDPETTDSILQLIRDLKEKLAMTVVLITHEMDVVREICDRVAIMEDGHVVEEGPVDQVFSQPKSKTGRSFLGKRPGSLGISPKGLEGRGISA